MTERNAYIPPQGHFYVCEKTSLALLGVIISKTETRHTIFLIKTGK